MKFPNVKNPSSETETNPTNTIQVNLAWLRSQVGPYGKQKLKSDPSILPKLERRMQNKN
jgi:hypothetical protein